jgi:hypothetical protein
LLIVIEQDSPFTELFPEDLVLRAQILDDLLLLTINPAGENEQQKLPGLKDEVHGRPVVEGESP